MGTAAVAHRALLASRLPWFLGGAAPAAAGAGYIYIDIHLYISWCTVLRLICAVNYNYIELIHFLTAQNQSAAPAPHFLLTNHQCEDIKNTFILAHFVPSLFRLFYLVYFIVVSVWIFRTKSEIFKLVITILVH